MGIKKHVFYCTHKSAQYVFADGTVAAFVDGKYYTAKKKEIAELEDACESNPYLYFNPDQREVDMDTITPEAILRAQVEKEVAERFEAAKLLELSATKDGADSITSAQLQSLQNVAAKVAKDNVK